MDWGFVLRTVRLLHRNLTDPSLVVTSRNTKIYASLDLEHHMLYTWIDKEREAESFDIPQPKWMQMIWR